MLNQIRTLVAHRYTGTGRELAFDEQVLDSTTVAGPRWTSAWMLPVGTRYHALHHFVPSLPYHSLGAVHRALLARCDVTEPYPRTERLGLAALLVELWRDADYDRAPWHVGSPRSGLDS
jgi:fatty acid desaturase